MKAGSTLVEEFGLKDALHSSGELFRRSMNKTLGVILIVLGLVGLAWGGFTYTTREKVVDVGPIHASRDKTHTVPLPPIVGAVALVAGVILVAAGKNQ
jgi:drug/metabolite transporter (DMT)-like permease